jgi:hypothetical protein
MSMDIQKTTEFIRGQQAQTEANLKELSFRQLEAVKETAALKSELRNAIRNELASKVDDQITKLAAAQLVTEERLQAFLSASKSGNGHTS